MIGILKRSQTWLACVLLVTLLASGCTAPASSSADVSGKLELAIKYLTESNYEQAILAYREVIKVDKRNATAYKGLGMAFALQDDMVQAEKVLQDGVKAVAGDVALNLTLAGLLGDLDRNADAEAIYQTLASKPDAGYAAVKSYADYLWERQRKDEALLVLEKAAGGKNDYRLENLLASFYIKANQPGKAGDKLAASLTLQPDQGEGYQLLTRLSQRGSEDASVSVPVQGLAADLIKLEGLAGKGQSQSLLDAFQAMSESTRHSPRGIWLLAQARMKLGDAAGAVNALNGISIDSLKDGILSNAIAGLYLECGNTEKARQLAEKGMTLEATGLTGYVVMYRATPEADRSGLTWLLKYALASNDSYEGAFASLLRQGIPLSELLSSKLLTRLKNIAIEDKLIHMLNSNQEIAQLQTRYAQDSFSVHYPELTYYDRKQNISYVTFVYTPEGLSHGGDFAGWVLSGAENTWKNMVVKVRNPRLYGPEVLGDYGWSMENYGGWDDGIMRDHLEQLLENGDNRVLWQGEHWWGVVAGDVPLEDLLQSPRFKDYPVVFVEI